MIRTTCLNVFASLIVLAIGCNSGDKPSDPDIGKSTEEKPKVAYVTNGVASFWVIAESGVKQGGAGL